jgi:hypothetical protein
MKNNNKIYIILLIFALLSFFLIVFFIWPLTSEIEKNSNDLISAKNNEIALSAQINEAENFKKNYQAYKPNLDEIDRLFVDPDNPVDFIQFLEDTASAYKITSKISLPPSSQNYQGTSQNFIIFQFSSSGNFSAVSNFLKKIESSPYLIEIENLTIQNSQEAALASSALGKKSGAANITKDYSLREVSAAFTIKVFTNAVK